RCRETDDKEWLDVLVRVLHTAEADPPDVVARKRALARDEIRVVLAHRASNLWPEPVDLLELAGVGETVTAGGQAGEDEREPVAVLARPRGDTLAGWLATEPPLSARLGLVAELLTFVGGAHAEGLLLHGLGPSAFVVDAQGYLGYLASDWVLRQE